MSTDTRYMVGKEVDGVWVSHTCTLRNLHKHQDACLLINDGGAEKRAPIHSIELIPDDAKVLAQNGVMGYLPGDVFKRHYLEEIGSRESSD